MRRLWLAGALLLTAACGPANPPPPGAGDCTTPGCIPSGAGGAGSGADGGGGGGASPEGSVSSGSITVDFNVGRTRDTRFSEVLPFTGPVRVTANGTMGTVVFFADAGITSSGTLQHVSSGVNWFSVEDPSGTAKILPTLQAASVDPPMSFVPLLAIFSDQLMPLVIDTVPWAPLPAHATLIVIFTRAGTPLTGVTIGSKLPQGATVAYEQDGPYISTMTNPDVATASSGVAVVRDIDNVATFPSTTDLAFEYRLGTSTLPLQTKVAQNFVTWMSVSVP
jgi:hypothetical protein